MALAPMDGVTDGSTRAVMSALFGGRSGISICVSEFVRVTRQPVPEHVFLRHCPELETGGHTAEGIPVFVQLLGGDPLWMARAATVAAQMGAPGIDLNFGCPAKTVNNSDGGATLLRDPCRVEAVTRAVRDAVPAHIPVTPKIRVGWADADRIVDIAKAAEQGGGSWLTIHGRTRRQGYAPPVDYGAIGRARAAVDMPVVANGDLFDVEALIACAEASGCRGFMIGRGAMGRPELFAQIRGWRDGPGEGDEIRPGTRDGATGRGPLSAVEMGGLLQRYVARMVADGAAEGPALGRLKQWLRMGGLSRGVAGPAASGPTPDTGFDLGAWFDAIKRERSLRAACVLLERLSGASPGPSPERASGPVSPLQG